ncbi:MAG: sulfate adenylyltransferase [Rhodospirillaceae bacterium]|nr:MAG: sulfate adenylyltransferase [Rhodospirillaceae bacterium]
MSQLVPPHGGEALKPLLIPEYERADEIEHAKKLKSLTMTSREASDVLMLGMGAYTPLDGFMGEADWRSVSVDMKLENGLFWPIPITLSCTEEQAADFDIGSEIALIDPDSGDILAVLDVQEKYSPDKELECEHVFRTTDGAHPGVEKVMDQGNVNLAGIVKCLGEGEYPDLYPELYLRPEESRAKFAEKGWTTISAFQTRNPMHRSHEYLTKIAVEITDGVFIHQVLGKLKPGDIPAKVRTEAIQAMIDHYFVPGTVIQAGYPIEMRYAGPREALFHALIRQNFGCSHLVVGRDHAGVGDYYGPFDAHHIFDKIEPDSLQTQALKIDITFYCKKCHGMATGRTCPHGDESRLNISGTRLREMFSNHEKVPAEFGRPEVVEVLQRYYDSLD